MPKVTTQKRMPSLPSFSKLMSLKSSPTVDIYSDIRKSYFDGDDATYTYEYKSDYSSTPDDPYTVDFKGDLDVHQSCY